MPQKLHPQSDNPALSKLEKKVQSLVQAHFAKSKCVGLSIGILQNQNKHFYNYGSLRKRDRLTPTQYSLYEIGSITKTFAGLLLAKAVLEKKIRLREPINSYLPDSIPLIGLKGQALNVIHLSNHTSGLPRLPDNFSPADWGNPYIDYTEKKLLSYLRKVGLTNVPGKKFEYSNLSTGILGYILQRVYGMSFERLVKDFICQDAGMYSTKQILWKKDRAVLAQGYSASGKPQSCWDSSVLAAAGCLKSNTEDLLRYAAMQLNPPKDLLGKAVRLSQRATFSDRHQKIGLNWLIQNWGWGELLFHNGCTGGYSSFLAMNLKTKNAVIILSNMSVSCDELGEKILEWVDAAKHAAA